MHDTSNEGKKPYWQEKCLSEMTQDEWERLCDGCGKCCIILLEDDESDAVWETDIACKLFDQCNRTCLNYKQRQKYVPGCVQLTPGNIDQLDWMPESCAYRLLAHGKPLPQWHPLITGDRDSTVRAGMAVKIPLHHEDDIPEDYTEDHITRRRL